MVILVVHDIYIVIKVHYDLFDNLHCVSINM